MTRFVQLPRFALGRTVALGAIALLLASAVGCSRPKPESPPEASVTVEPQSEIPAPPETVLVSSDGASRLTLPTGWQAENQLHDSAELQAANYERKLYVIVLSESKEALKAEEPDTNWTIETHSETTRKLLEDRLKAAGEIEVGDPVTLKVGAYPAIQYEIRGKLGDLDVVYLHTTVETSTHFHQILAWTVPETLAANRTELDRVIQSFQEIPESERSPVPSRTESESANDEPSEAEPSPQN
ncbi:MAG: hypothetical protein IGR76_08205 [Synechococcales cyanobacterium T60_A2020_003]|nr:hypothetical protein [Synechococcales cyanobacterium T60_A2020_003]